MDRRRLLQFAFTTVFVLFLILLLFKFRPKFDAPAPVEPEQVKRTAEGTLSARGFTYRQETAGKVEFTATAAADTPSMTARKRYSQASPCTAPAEPPDPSSVSSPTPL